MRPHKLTTPLLVAAGTVMTERALRSRYESWGATFEEVRDTLPGDGFVTEPRRASTRAISIEATPEVVWRWVVQMGHARGGLYSYDWVENLVGCDLHSADEVLPEHQTLHPGDLVRMGPDGYPAFSVAEVAPPHHLVLVSADSRSGRPTFDDESSFGTTWQWVLDPSGTGTRLVSRQRLSYPAGQAVMWSVVQPLAFIMERKMLLGIKQRAERSTQNVMKSQLEMESNTSAAVTVSVVPQPQSTESSPSSNESIESSPPSP